MRAGLRNFRSQTREERGLHLLLYARFDVNRSAHTLSTVDNCQQIVNSCYYFDQ